MFDSVILIAFGWGAFSAASLPLGAMLGLAWKPSQKINSAFMAYGAGALLFALTIELFGHVPHYVEGHGSEILYAVFFGALLGGGIFDLVNNILNNQGAYLRRLSSAKSYVSKLKYRRAKHIIEGLSKVKALRMIPPNKLEKLIRSIDVVKFDSGVPVFKQGDKATEMYFIISGSIDIIIHEFDGKIKKVATLEEGEILGEMGILLDVPRTADAMVVKKARLYRLTKHELDKIFDTLPELKEEIKSIATSRLGELSLKGESESVEEWEEKTFEYLKRNYSAITMEDVKKENLQHNEGSASMAIWLGILIDSIPESLIIGILALNPDGMSLAFIAGVFLANMPEAMSSSVSMHQYGMKYKKILVMWGSLCLITGIGAAFGASLFPLHPTGNMLILVIGIESLAAGAMLTMIAETMLPEAFEHGGSIVGVSTLLGFLSALLVKVLG